MVSPVIYHEGNEIQGRTAGFYRLGSLLYGWERMGTECLVNRSGRAGSANHGFPPALIVKKTKAYDIRFAIRNIDGILPS